MERLNGKVAVVTAGATGIGKAISTLFVEEGAKVIIANRNAERGEAVAQELGKNAYFYRTDVSDGNSVRGLMKYVENTFGVLDILMNNAALSISNSIELTSEENWDDTFKTNAKGYFMCAKYGLPLLKRSKAASIVNTSSELSIVACKNNLAYNSSKGAVMSFTRSLALELAPYNIRVNAICPAGTLTDAFVEDLKKNGQNYQERYDALVEKYPLGKTLGRVAMPREVAYAALFLASEESSFITGTHIMIDGGFTAT